MFPKVVCSAHFISEAISKDICAQLARNVVNLVPQVVDYTCTICKSLTLDPETVHHICTACMQKNRIEKSHKVALTDLETWSLVRQD